MSHSFILLYICAFFEKSNHITVRNDSHENMYYMNNRLYLLQTGQVHCLEYGKRCSILTKSARYNAFGHRAKYIGCHDNLQLSNIGNYLKTIPLRSSCMFLDICSWSHSTWVHMYTYVCLLYLFVLVMASSLRRIWRVSECLMYSTIHHKFIFTKLSSLLSYRTP